MIAFKIGDEYLDLPEDFTLGVEEHNSLFRSDTVPGLLTYPGMLPPTKKNNRLLGFPGLLNTSDTPGINEIPCSCYVQGILWRSGKLNILKVSSKGFSFNFQSGAGDVSGKDISLKDIDLGTDTLSYQTAAIYPAANFILFPVKNADFYGDKNPDFKGYLNYYDTAFRTNVSAASEFAVVPFPFLSYIFRKVMAHFGYTVAPGWLDTPEISKKTIYNTYALDKKVGGVNVFETAIDFRNHVPDLKAVEFLNAIRSRFFLDYDFDAKSKTLTITPLLDVIEDQAYIDQTGKLDASYETEPNNTDGWLLEMEMDSGDELTKEGVATWNKFTIGNGGETISTKASTLQMNRGVVSFQNTRSWLVPEAAQKGGSPEFGMGNNKCGLRLLTYLGMQPDSAGNLYPLGSADVVNYNGLTVGTHSHYWDGPNGIYLKSAKAWLDFRSYTRKIDRSVNLDIVDLLTLDHKRKWLSAGPEGTVKMLYEKLSYSISNSGIKPTKGTFYKTKL